MITKWRGCPKSL